MGHHNSSYLDSALNPKELKMVVKVLVKVILKDKKVFHTDAIAARGLSGIVVASIVAYETGLPLVAIRKQDTNHGNYTTEYHREFKNFVIIDDMIASGETMRSIVSEIGQASSLATCRKLYLYDQIDPPLQYVLDLVGDFYGFKVEHTSPSKPYLRYQ